MVLFLSSSVVRFFFSTESMAFWEPNLPCQHAFQLRRPLGRCEIPSVVVSTPASRSKRCFSFNAAFGVCCDVQPTICQDGLSTCAACQPASPCHPGHRPTARSAPHCANASQQITSVDVDWRRSSQSFPSPSPAPSPTSNSANLLHVPGPERVTGTSGPAPTVFELHQPDCLNTLPKVCH